MRRPRATAYDHRSAPPHPRTRPAPWHLAPGPLNTITDVANMRVGHIIPMDGKAIRTGITAILPPGNSLFQESVPGAREGDAR